MCVFSPYFFILVIINIQWNDWVEKWAKHCFSTSTPTPPPPPLKLCYLIVVGVLHVARWLNQVDVMCLSCAGDSWQASANLTPAAGGAHLCYYHKASENLSLGVELEGSLRTQECATTIGYQLEIPNANLTFRGELSKVYICLDVVMTLRWRFLRLQDHFLPHETWYISGLKISVYVDR